MYILFDGWFFILKRFLNEKLLYFGQKGQDMNVANTARVDLHFLHFVHIHLTTYLHLFLVR